MFKTHLTKTLSAGVGALLALPALVGATTLVNGALNLPATPVTATQSWNANGALSTVTTTLSNVPAGYDVTDGVYPGWCMEDNKRPDAPPGSQVTLYDSTTSVANLPATYQGVPWEQVNWILNHKQGTVKDVQVAIWIAVGYYDNTFPSTAASDAMVADAIANAAGYIPGAGSLAAVLLYTDGIGPDGYQDTFIEIVVPEEPPPGGEGCTPGFWKRDGGKFGFNNWKPTGYQPTDDFDGVFGTSYFSGGLSLLDSLTPGNNGGYGEVIRHGTAALLNAAHPEVTFYPYSVAEVKAFVQAGNAAPLVTANEELCPLQRIKD